MDSDTVIQIVGAFLLGDDIDDFPDISRLHHWQLGAAMLAFPLLRNAFSRRDVATP